jgi:GT2 family glycosyltransferase
MFWLTGACLALTIDMFDEVGGFDESYFLYWEDVDFSYRAGLAGAELLVREDLTVVHDEGGTQGQRSGRAKSQTYYYYNCRNRLVFAAKHLGARSILRWALLTPQQSWAVLLRGGRRQLLDSPITAMAAVRGSLAGLMYVASVVLRVRPKPPRPSGHRPM